MKEMNKKRNIFYLYIIFIPSDMYKLTAQMNLFLSLFTSKLIKLFIKSEHISMIKFFKNQLHLN